MLTVSNYEISDTRLMFPTKHRLSLNCKSAHVQKNSLRCATIFFFRSHTAGTHVFVFGEKHRGIKKSPHLQKLKKLWEGVMEYEIRTP
jgi:hypothetical protein